MELIVGTSKLLSVASNIGSIKSFGTDIIIKTISFTASNIYYLTTKIISKSKSNKKINNLEQVEKELDLLETIKIYDSWVTELKNKKSEFLNNSPTIKISIEAINASLDDLHKILLIIDKKVHEHENKYFNKWKTLDLDEDINELKFKKKILDSRFEMLQKIKSDLIK